MPLFGFSATAVDRLRKKLNRFVSQPAPSPTLGVKQEYGALQGQAASVGQSVLSVLSTVPGNGWLDSWTASLHRHSFKPSPPSPRTPPGGCADSCRSEYVTET